MIRFLAFISRHPGAAGPGPPGWSCIHQGRRVCVWTSEPSAPWLRLRDGVCLGALDARTDRFDELAGGWGAYVAVQETPTAAMVLRDPSGRIPAYWLRTRAADLVCSHLQDLAPWLDEPLGIDWGGLTAFLLGDYMPGRRTALRGVEELTPGEAMVFSQGEVSTRAAWRPGVFWSEPYGDVEEARGALRQAVEASVAFWAQRYSRILLDLSGGLDSSAILGLLAGCATRPLITCLNGAVAHAESDERAFARIAAQAAGAPLLEADASALVADYSRRERPPLQPRPSAQLRGAGLDAVALPLARQAGAQAYFTGRGGDHVFYVGAPTIAARDRLAHRPLRPGFLTTAYEIARATGQPLTRVLSEAVRPPSGARDLVALVPVASPFVRPEAAEAAASAARAHPWAQAAAASAPLGKIRQVCFLVELQRQYDRIGRAAELDEVHPFIAQPVLEACLRTPSYMFVAGGVARGLQRAAFADVLPPEILERRTKGATTSHSIRTLSRNLAYLRQRLLDGELVREGLLDRTALEAHLTPAALLDGRMRPALADCVSAQLWLEDARESLAGPAVGDRAAAGA
jgi:asparagine synthase (glutamine-hydrolysing)